MVMRINLNSCVRRVLGAGAIALCFAGTAHAETYELNKFLRGGGGGKDPAKQRIAQGMGAYICVDVSRTREPNSVLFYLWSAIPEPNSRITDVAIDTGRHADLFSSVSAVVQASNLKAMVGPGKSHAFLHPLKPDFLIVFKSSAGPRKGGLAAGLAPGQGIVVAATLGTGKTFANVIGALNEGLNPGTATTGLRVAVIGKYLLGGPPPGVGSIHDDGGFVISAVSARCRRG